MRKGATKRLNPPRNVHGFDHGPQNVVEAGFPKTPSERPQDRTASPAEVLGRNVPQLDVEPILDQPHESARVRARLTSPSKPIECPKPPK